MSEARVHSAQSESDLQAAFDTSAFHRLIGGKLRLTDAGIVLQTELGEDFSTALGRVHGGVVASLLDTAATWALMARTSGLWVTADLRVDYLRPVPLGRVDVEGVVVKAGRRIGTAKAAVLVNGESAATAVGTFLPIGSEG